MNYITLKFRIKDSTSHKKLEAYAHSVNQVWNYCNEVSYKSITYNGKWLTGYDLNKLTVGTAHIIKLPSATIDIIGQQYAQKRKQFKKLRLKWRSPKKSLGWIPFKAASIKYLSDGKIRFNHNIFSFWQTRQIGNIKCGSFNQDAQGRWYINLSCEDIEYTYKKSAQSIGVDLGLKATATYSNGEVFEGVKATQKYAARLAIAQRAKKKKQVSKIHAKIKNVRKNSLHKETTRIVKNYDLIVVGDVSSKKLKKTKMAKSVSDNAWYAYKSLLAYKTIRFGKEMKVVKENWTTVTCSGCLQKTFPQKGGLGSLSVREWTCNICGSIHDRDVNAAKNILRIGHDTLNKGA